MTDPPIPYTNLDLVEVGLSAPCTETQKNKTHKTSGKKELTLVEEVEEYLRMEAAKERAARNKNEQYPTFSISSSSLYSKSTHQNNE